MRGAIRLGGRPPPALGNRGVEEATGEFLFFVDDGIIVEEGTIAALLTAPEETGASASFGCCLAVPEAPCPEEALKVF